MSSLGHDKIARSLTNTQNNTKTRRILRRNRQLERKHFLCVFQKKKFLFSFFLIISYMISPRLVELPPWYGQ